MTEEEKEVRRSYRAVFGSRLGRKVLAHLLVRLQWFNTAPNEEAVVLQNVAKWLLKTMGIFEAENVDSIVNQLLKIPLKE